jgi:hypothetical protein
VEVVLAPTFLRRLVRKPPHRHWASKSVRVANYLGTSTMGAIVPGGLRGRDGEVAEAGQSRVEINPVTVVPQGEAGFGQRVSVSTSV